MLNFSEKKKYMYLCTFWIIHSPWNVAGSWNLSLRKTGTYLFYTVAADSHVLQEARASAAMILAWFSTNNVTSKQLMVTAYDSQRIWIATLYSVYNSSTVLVLKPEYSKINRSIPWMMMPWLQPPCVARTSASMVLTVQYKQILCEGTFNSLRASDAYMHQHDQ